MSVPHVCSKRVGGGRREFSRKRSQKSVSFHKCMKGSTDISPKLMSPHTNISIKLQVPSDFISAISILAPKLLFLLGLVKGFGKSKGQRSKIGIKIRNKNQKQKSLLSPVLTSLLKHSVFLCLVHFRRTCAEHSEGVCMQVC